MSSSHSLTSIDVSEYDRIEAAMSESERGRWFLETYLQRNRAHDTGILLEAIARLETVVTGERDQDQIGRVRGDVLDMAHAIARTKAEIAAIQTPDHDQSRLGGASAALDAIVRSTERATSEILSSAEQVQESAWTLRESGSDAEICDELDRRATAIYTACSFQDLTAQRTARIIHTLRYLEERLAAMMAVWGDALDTVPPAPGEGRGEGHGDLPADLCQSDVDRYLDMAGSAAETIPPVAAFPSAEAVSAADDIVFLEATDPVRGPDAEAPQAIAPEPEDALPATDERNPGEFEAAEVEEAGLTEPDTDQAEAPSVEAPSAIDDVSVDHADLAGPTESQLAQAQLIEAESDEAKFDEAKFDEAKFDEIGSDETESVIADDAADAGTDPLALAIAAASVQAQIDIASAFAEIDALSEDEKRALFS